MSVRLPAGITGLGPARSDKTNFYRWGHTVARNRGLDVHPITTPSVGCSFDLMRLERGRRVWWLLHNRYVPLVAASAVNPMCGVALAVECAFVDIAYDEMTDGSDVSLMTSTSLNERLTTEHWRDLSKEEVDHAATFKPETVGQVIFNYWD